MFVPLHSFTQWYQSTTTSFGGGSSGSTCNRGGVRSRSGSKTSCSMSSKGSSSATRACGGPLHKGMLGR